MRSQALAHILLAVVLTALTATPKHARQTAKDVPKPITVVKSQAGSNGRTKRPGQETRASGKLLVLHVVDAREKPIQGVVITATGESSKATTNEDGKAHLKLAPKTQPNDEITLTIVSSPNGGNLVFFPPHSARVRFVPFNDRTQNVVVVMLVDYDDRAWLMNPKRVAAVTASINTESAPTEVRETGSPELRRKAITKDVAEDVGTTFEELDEAIRELPKKTVDPYEAGQVALYEREYDKASDLLSEALKNKENDVAETAWFLGQARYEQAKYTQAVEAFQKASNIKPDDLRILRNLGLALHSDGQYDKAEKVFKQLVENTRKEQGAYHLDMASAQSNLSAVYQQQGKYDLAEEAALLSLSIREKKLKPDHPEVGQSQTDLAGIYMSQGNYGKGGKLYLKALAIHEKQSWPNDLSLATTRFNLAGYYQVQGEYAKAERLYQDALATYKKVLRPDHPTIAVTINGLAGLYLSQGRYDEAERSYRDALAAYKKVLRPGHSVIAVGINGLAGACMNQGKYDEAESLYGDALAILRSALRPDHPVLASTRVALAGAHMSQGKYGDVESSIQSALTTLEKGLGADHPELTGGHLLLSLLYSMRGKTGLAETHCRRALVILEKAFGKDHYFTIPSLNGLMVIYESKERYDDAQVVSERILKILERTLEPDHPDIASALNSLAWIYYWQGNYAGARRPAERALRILESMQNEDAIVRCLDTLANIKGAQGEYSEAEKLFKRVIDSFKRLRPDQPDVAIAIRGLAKLYTDQGRYTDAEPLFIQAIGIQKQKLGEVNSELARSLKEYASLLRKTHREAEAAELEKQAKVIKDKYAQQQQQGNR